MGKINSSLVAKLSVFLLFSSCVARDPSDSVSGPIWIKAPVFDANSKSYQLKKVKLETVENLKTLSGTSGQFFYAPGSMNGKLVGFQPSIKLARDAEGTYFPLDLLSLQMVSIYYSLEQLRFFDRELGIEAASRWPRNVALDARLPGSREDYRHNNAFFSPDLDAMVFVPYTQRSLPIAMNAGVIGHEHFHGLFDHFLDRTLKQKKLYQNEDGEAQVEAKNCSGVKNRGRYLSILNRALNEGLADVWAWLTTGDTQFVERSLRTRLRQGSDHHLQGEKITRPETSRPLCGKLGPVRVSRDLNSEVLGEIENCACVALRINEASLGAKSESEARENALGLAYHLGSRMAKVIKQFILSGESSTVSLEARRQVAKALVRGLQKFESQLLESSKESWPEPQAVLSLFVDEISDAIEGNCDFVRSKLGGNLKAKCRASEARNPSSETSPPLKVSLFVSSDSRFERSEKQDLDQRQMYTFGMGLRKGRWMGILDGGSHVGISSLGNVSLERKFEQYTGSLLFIPPSQQLGPYIGAGLGFYRDVANLSLDAFQSRSEGQWETLNVFQLGLRFFANTPIWLSTEVKMLLGGRIDPDPMIGYAVRIGSEF